VPAPLQHPILGGNSFAAAHSREWSIFWEPFLRNSALLFLPPDLSHLIDALVIFLSPVCFLRSPSKRSSLGKKKSPSKFVMSPDFALFQERYWVNFPTIPTCLFNGFDPPFPTQELTLPDGPPLGPPLRPAPTPQPRRPPPQMVSQPKRKTGIFPVQVGFDLNSGKALFESNRSPRRKTSVRPLKNARSPTSRRRKPEVFPV